MRDLRPMPCLRRPRADALQEDGLPEHWSGEERETVKAGILAEVNAHILEVAGESPSRSPQWEFFCECGRLDCHEMVPMTVVEYMSVRERANAVLAHGHRLDHFASAETLAKDAHALLSQARQRARRTAKEPT